MNTITRRIECANVPIFSSRNQGWENILVELFQNPAGEGKFHYPNEHVIYLSLAPRPVRLLQIQDGKTYSGLYGKGDISITPAETTFFARWDSDDCLLQIRMPSDFITKVATEAMEMNPDRLELVPEFRMRNPQIEVIAMMLLTELKQDNLGNKRNYSARNYGVSNSIGSSYGKILLETEIIKVL
jgi:AraC family transcriptional regulator